MEDNEKIRVWGIRTQDDQLFLRDNKIAISWMELRGFSDILDCFKHEMKIGDYVVFPSKSDGMINIGIVQGEYTYAASAGTYVHLRDVKWLKHIPHTEFSHRAIEAICPVKSLFAIEKYSDEYLAALKKDKEQEWQWCLVGNIVESHEFGENHELKYGTKQFSAGTKVYLAPVCWGDGYEKIYVIGSPRHGRGYIEIVMNSKYIENLRLQKVFQPGVLKRMKNSKTHWWGNTDSARDEIIEYLVVRNPEEAENARRKYANPNRVESWYNMTKEQWMENQ